MDDSLNQRFVEMVTNLVNFKFRSNHDFIGQANKVSFFIQPQSAYESQLLFDFRPIYTILHLALVFIVCLLVFRIVKLVLSIANKNY